MATNAILAQAELSGMEGLSVFQQQLMEQSLFIAILYGTVFAVGFVLLAGFTMRIQSRPVSWARPVQALLERPWTARDACGVVIPLILLQVLFGLGYTFLDPAGGLGEDRAERAMVALQGVIFHGACFVLIVVLMRMRKLNWAESFGWSRRGALVHAVAGAAILVGVMPLIIAYNLAAQIIMQWWGMTPEVQEVTRIISGASGWPAKVYFVLLAVVVAPVVEEMLFRGVLLPALARLTGVRPALVIVAALFAVVHGLQMPAVVVFFILSIAFSLAYIHRGSLIAPVVMHALFNGMTMLVLLRM